MGVKPGDSPDRSTVDSIVHWIEIDAGDGKAEALRSDMEDVILGEREEETVVQYGDGSDDHCG